MRPLLSKMLALVAVLSLGGTVANAQSASSSGAEAAEMGATASNAGGNASASTPAANRKQSHDKASPMMRTGDSPAPTGPDTSTVQPDTSDLTGSTGASITMPQGTPPPGVTPPNGSAPDTGGGAGGDTVPSDESGPH